MIIKSVELSDFRNYERADIKLDRAVNIFFGDNAQGKTNFLESVYVSATSKSHKSVKDKEMIRFNCDEGHIRTIVEKNGRDYCIDMHLKKNRSKGIAVDKVPLRRAAELFGILNIVFFSPEDLNIIKSGPSERRRFIDSELCQLDRIYLSNLSNYNHVLMQRNKLLKDIIFNPDLESTLDVWDEQLINFGTEIIKSRKKFIKELREIVKTVHSDISGKKEELFIDYEFSADEDSFKEKLKESKKRDLKTLQTNYGPHRDDMIFTINDVDIRHYGSQGQQRTAALSLKLSEIEMVKKVTGEKPVLLLDDVLSELDSSRQNNLLSSISDIQTLITCTGLDDFIKNNFKIHKVFYVNNGVVTPKGDIND